MRQRCRPPVIARVNKHLKWSPGLFWMRSCLIIDVCQCRTVGQHGADILESAAILLVAFPQFLEIRILLPEGPQNLLLNHPCWVHILSQVVHKTQKRVDRRRARRLGPLSELLNFSRLSTLAELTAHHPPQLQFWLIELPLHKLKLETRVRSFATEQGHVLNMLIQGATTHWDVIHQGSTEWLAILVPETPKLSGNVALHFCRSGRWPKRHPRPLIQTRPRTDNQHLSCALIQQELGVSPDRIHNCVMLLEGCHIESLLWIG